MILETLQLTETLLFIVLTENVFKIHLALLIQKLIKATCFPPFSWIALESAFYIEVQKLNDTLHTISTGSKRKYVLDKQLLSILNAVFIDDY